MRPDLSRWEPASVDEVAAAFTRHPGPWWVVGGMAIELAVGRRICDHADIDIGVLPAGHIAALAILGVPERTWLRTALERRDPGHPWLGQLRLS